MGVCQSKEDNPKNKTYLLQTLDEHQGGINCMGLSEDGSVLATGSEDCTARLWTTKTSLCECIGILKGHEDYINCLLMEDNYVITGSADKTIRKWEMSTCDCVHVFRGHTSLLNRIICTGDFLFSSSYDRTARCWDFDTGECIRVFSGHKRGVYPLVFIPAPDDAAAAPAAQPGSAGDEEDDRFDWDGNKDILITGAADFTARSWSFETGKCLHVFKEHEGGITCMTTDNEGKILFTGSTDQTIRSWDILKGTRLKLFSGHQASVICMTVIGKLMYTGSSDMTARSWVTEFGDCTRVFKGHKHTISCIRHSKGLSAGDNAAKCYCAKSATLKRTFKSHEGCVNKLEHTPTVATHCGHFTYSVEVFTSSGDGEAHCYDAKSGSIKRTFVGHTFAINTMQVVDGKLFTGSHDATLRVWDITGINNDTAFGVPKKADDTKARDTPTEKTNKVHPGENGASKTKNSSTVIMIDDDENMNEQTHVDENMANFTGNIDTAKTRRR